MFRRIMLLVVLLSLVVGVYGLPSDSVTSPSVIRSDDQDGCTILDLKMKWNLVSFPVEGVDLPKDITPYSLEEGKYRKVETPLPGRGYWVYSVEPRKIEVYGSPVDRVEWYLYEGKHLLGGPSSEVSVDEVREILDAQVGEGRYELEVYEYSSGRYQPVKVIKPFVGYLVKYEGPETKVVLGGKEGVCDHTLTFSDRVKERVVDGLEIDYLGMTKDGRLRFVVYDKSAGKKEMFNLTEGKRFTYVSHKRVGKEKTSPAVKYAFSLLDVGNVSQRSSQPTIPGAISRPVRPVGSPSSEVSLCVEEMNVTCIYDCTDITEPGDYVLCSDITASSLTNSSGGCINILSSRVNLDGMGHSIRGGTGFVDGIRVSGYSYVNIQNITISGFARDGIFLYSVDHNVVSNCSIYNNSNIGLSLSGSNNLLIGNNLYSNFGGGLSESMSSFNNTIINNNISFNNIHGLFLDGSNDKVFSNRIISNSGSGIYLYISARFNIIANNTVFNNSENGISVTYTGDAVNNTFMNNYVCFNNLSDIFDTSRRNVYINTTYDTSEPDDPDYFDKIGSCAAECPEGYTSVDVGERLFLGSFDGHNYYFYRSSESDYQILEDDSVVFDSSTSSEGDGGILYGLPNDHFVGVEMLRGHPSGYCVLGINGSFSHVESGDMFIPPTTTHPLGMYESKLLINDVIDNRLGNRVEDSMSRDDRLTNSSPLTLGVPGPSYVFHLYQYQPPRNVLAHWSHDASECLSIRETQDIILYGTTPIDSVDSDVVTRIKSFGYRIKFGDTVDEEPFPSGLNYYGLPVCDRDEDGDWSYCVREGTEDYDHSIVSQRVVIGFLGDDWVITGMTPPEGTAPEDDVRRTREGEISLAHEAAHSNLSVGDSITYHNLRIVLDDISVGDDRFAILSIYDSDTDLLLKQVRVSPGVPLPVLLDDVLPTCHNPVIIHVWQTTPGFHLDSRWAEVSVFDKEIELVNGSTVELTDPYTGRRWTPEVLLFWKNYNATGSTWDALREIVLLDGTTHELNTDNEISYPWGVVRYAGLTDSERYELSFRIVEGFTDCDGVYHSPALEIRSTYPEGGLGFVRFSSEHIINETMWVDHAYVPDDHGLYVFDSSLGCYQDVLEEWNGLLYRPYFPEEIHPYSTQLGSSVSRPIPLLLYNYYYKEIVLWEDAGPGGDQRRNINILQFKIVNDSSGYRFTGPSSDEGPDYLYGIRAPSLMCYLLLGLHEDGWVPGDVLWYGVCKNMTLHRSGYTERGTAITEFSSDEVRLSIPEDITQVVLEVSPQPYRVYDTYPEITCPDGYQPVTPCDPLAVGDGEHYISYAGRRPDGAGEFVLWSTEDPTSTSWTGGPGDVWTTSLFSLTVGSVREDGACVNMSYEESPTCSDMDLFYGSIGESHYLSPDHTIGLEFMDVDLLKDTDCKPFAIFRVTDYDSEEEYLLKIKEGETDSITLRGTTYYIHVDDINLTSLPGSTTCNVSVYCEGDGAPDTTVNGYERGYSLIRMYDSICSGHHCVDVSGFNYEYRDGHPIPYVMLIDEYSWVSRKIHPGEVVSFGPDLNISLYDVYLPLFSISGMAFAKLVDEPGTTNPWEDYDLVMHLGRGPILDRDGEEWNFLVAGISQDGCEGDTLCNYVLLDVKKRDPSSSYWTHLTSVKVRENSSVFLSPCDGCPTFNVSVGGIGYDIGLGVQFVYLNVEPTDQPPNYPCSGYALYRPGESVPSPHPEYRIQVGDSTYYQYDGPHGGWNVPAVFDVLNESGNVVRVIKVYPGHPVVWNSPHGPIRFDVCEVGNNLYVSMWWVRARVDDGSEGEPYCEDYDLVLGGDNITLDTGEYTFSDIHQDWFGGQLGCWYEPSAHLTSETEEDVYLPESDDNVCDMDVGTLSGYYYMYYRSGEPTGGTEAVRCDIVPWYMTVEEGDFTEFDVVCYDEEDNVVDCPEGLLVVTSPPHSVVTSPSGGYLFLASDETGIANVIASYIPTGSGAGGGFSCAGQVNVTESHPTCLPLHIKLYDGWNLISFPVIPEGLTLSDILTDHVYEPGTRTVDPGCVDRVTDPSGTTHPGVYRFDPSTETFVLCDDESPQPGVGYVVHANHSCVISLDSGESVNADGLYSGLPSGWNLIGSGCYNNQPMSTSIPDITNCFRMTSSGDWVPCPTDTVPVQGLGYMIRKR